VFADMNVLASLRLARQLARFLPSFLSGYVRHCVAALARNFPAVREPLADSRSRGFALNSRTQEFKNANSSVIAIRLRQRRGRASRCITAAQSRQVPRVLSCGLREAYESKFQLHASRSRLTIHALKPRLLVRLAGWKRDDLGQSCADRFDYVDNLPVYRSPSYLLADSSARRK